MAKRPAITPLTKGASTRHPGGFPFRIPSPRSSSALPEEAAAFSSPAQVATRSRGQVIGDHTAASLRMRGRLALEESAPEPEPDLLDEPDQPQPAPPAQTAPPVALPAPVAAVPVAQPAPSLTARPLVIEDTDRLWDWIRQDTTSGQRFFGATLTNSMALHRTMRGLLEAERDGIGLIRSIYYEAATAQHLGFVMLAPILAEERLALAHIYLRPDLRGRLAQFLPPLLELAAQDLPQYRIGVLPADLPQGRFYRQLLTPLGFQEHTIFVRPTAGPMR